MTGHLVVPAAGQAVVPSAGIRRGAANGSAEVRRLLEDRAYHIEFNGHLTNHAKHAVVALAGLGAATERITEYYQGYAELTSYGYGLEPSRAARRVIDEGTWWGLVGGRTDFSAYCDFFDRRERELGLEEMLRRYLRPLLPGWVGSFTHAAIHLGWGLAAGSRWMVIEGLAYLAFSYVTCHPERATTHRAVVERAVAAGGPQGERAVDSLLRITAGWAGDGGAFQRWVEEAVSGTGAVVPDAIHPELVRSGLQYRIARLLGLGHPSFYRLPSWIADQEPPESWEQLYYAVTLLYLAAPGDFILLHLITSLYAMEEIAARLPRENQREVITYFWLGALPIVLSEARLPDPARLAALHAAYEHAVDAPAERADARATAVDARATAAGAAAGDPAGTGDGGDGEGWATIVDRAIQEEEEHNPKLVYVLRQIWSRTAGKSIYRVAAANFTTTPELPPSFARPATE